MFVVTVAMFRQTNIGNFFHCTKRKQLQTSCARRSLTCVQTIMAAFQPALHASFLNDVSVCKCVHAVVMNELLFPSQPACRCMSVCLCLSGKCIWQKTTSFDLNNYSRYETCNLFFCLIHSECVFILK